MSEEAGFNGLMVGVAGIRGIVGKGLTPEVVCRYATAYGSMMGKGEMVVGRDGRPSGEMVFNAVCAGLQSVGCKVINLGIVPTPTIQLSIIRRNAQGGVAITASHNPQEWNALKFFSSSSLFLDENEGKRLRELIIKSDFSYVSWDHLGMFETYDKAIEDHISAILDIPDLDLAEIRKREFKVVVDSVNASGSNIFPQLLNELGCTVIKLNCEPSGIFPRSAEPLPENLTELCSVVVENSADLGFAVDPDADRLAIIDETGHPIGEEYTLTLAVDFVLRHKRGTVVANVSTTRALDELAKKYRVSLLRTKVGEVYVAKKMKDVNAIIGGEGNGGVILPEVHLGRDAPVAAALILQLMTELNLPLSKIITELPKYEMVKDKVQLERFSPQELIPLIENSLIGAEIDKTDGIKFNFANSWVQVRPSNTEPIVRVFAEAPMRDIAISLCAEMKEKISNLEKRED